MVTFIYKHQVAYSLTITCLRKKLFERLESHTKQIINRTILKAAWGESFHLCWPPIQLKLKVILKERECLNVDQDSTSAFQELKIDNWNKQPSEIFQRWSQDSATSLHSYKLPTMYRWTWISPPIERTVAYPADHLFNNFQLRAPFSWSRSVAGSAFFDIRPLICPFIDFFLANNNKVGSYHDTRYNKDKLWNSPHNDRFNRI